MHRYIIHTPDARDIKIFFAARIFLCAVLLPNARPARMSAVIHSLFRNMYLIFMALRHIKRFVRTAVNALKRFRQLSFSNAGAYGDTEGRITL